ncbi:MAG: hypothetical protein PQJ61_10895 [Spirochaetales bacterium]|uniref:Uncharacterized protein n=1 Tax=Candidatus Thalassospirochaeta sargassi TaxID=3119039 RepID=A0AAJ1IJE1_9SPIO|nr:hypothetical protein [Spirochaetales bacterium]
MRLGEELAVRGEVLKENHILVNMQYTKNFGLTDTKSHRSRKVIIPEQLMIELKKYSELNNGGYVFSTNGGELPVYPDTLRLSLFKAFKAIGIEDEQRRVFVRITRYFPVSGSLLRIIRNLHSFSKE